jgi:hypothetical protein
MKVKAEINSNFSSKSSLFQLKTIQVQYVVVKTHSDIFVCLSETASETPPNAERAL